MTDIEQKALALVQEVQGFDCGVSIYHVHNAKLLRQALCRAIEQHEAFRQEVSDAAERLLEIVTLKRPWLQSDADQFKRFIITKPDPLVEALWEAGFAHNKDTANQLRAAIEKRGGKITWGEGYD